MIIFSRLMELQSLKLMIVDKKGQIRYHPLFNKNWDKLDNDIKLKLLSWSPNHDPKEACFCYLHDIKLLQLMTCVVCNTNKTRFTGFEYYPLAWRYVCSDKLCQVKFKDMRRKEKTLELPTNLNTPEERLQWLIDNKVIDKKFRPSSNALQLLKMKKQALYNWVYDIKEIPLCPICNKRPLAFIDFKQGYGKTCDDKTCQAKYSRIVIKEKYRVNNPAQIPGVREKLLSKQREETYKRIQIILESKHIQLLDSKDDFIKYGYNKDKYRFKCLDCGTVFEDKLHIQYVPFCPKCRYFKIGTSLEKKITAILDEYKIPYETHVKHLIKSDNNRPLEVDIWIPTKNLAIEVNGLYWHSYNVDENVSKELDKSLLLKDKAIYLLHLFEDSILFKENITKSILLAKLGIYHDTIHGRETTVQDVTYDKNLVKNFLDNNHLYGYQPYDIAIALLHNNDIVSMLTLKHRHDNSWEISRYANKLHTKIHGGFPKLLSYIKNVLSPKHNIQTLISYLHIELNNLPETSVYYRYGFALEKDINKDFYCVYNNRRYHRLFCQKQNLLKIAKEKDLNIDKIKYLTQNELATLLGIKIITLGSWKFKLQI